MMIWSGLIGDNESQAEMTWPVVRRVTNTQGNTLIRQKNLPIPDSNVAETSVMTLPQDYVAVQWPVVQFTLESRVAA